MKFKLLSSMIVLSNTHSCEEKILRTITLKMLCAHFFYSQYTKVEPFKSTSSQRVSSVLGRNTSMAVMHYSSSLLLVASQLASAFIHLHYYIYISSPEV